MLQDSDPCSEATVSRPTLPQKDQSRTDAIHKRDARLRRKPTQETGPTCLSIVAVRGWDHRCSGHPGVALGPRRPHTDHSGPAGRGVGLHLLIKSSAETMLGHFFFHHE